MTIRDWHFVEIVTKTIHILVLLINKTMTIAIII